jgi:hypothetical protein
MPFSSPFGYVQMQQRPDMPKSNSGCRSIKQNDMKKQWKKKNDVKAICRCM